MYSRPALSGGAIGSKKFVTEFIAVKVTEWVAQLDRLAKFAQSQPHVVFRPEHMASLDDGYI